MRLQYLLPIAEVVVSFILVVIPVLRYLPNYRLVGPDGKEIVCSDNCLYPNFYGIDSSAFSAAANLPAAIAVLPVLSAKWDYTKDGHDYFHDPVWRSLGFAIAGIVVWFFVGRLGDDVIAWRKVGNKGSARTSNAIFALVTAVIATLAAFETARSGYWPSFWYVVWLPLWIVIGYSFVTIEAIWWFRAKKESGCSYR